MGVKHSQPQFSGNELFHKQIIKYDICGGRAPSMIYTTYTNFFVEAKNVSRNSRQIWYNDHNTKKSLDG